MLVRARCRSFLPLVLYILWLTAGLQPNNAKRCGRAQLRSDLFVENERRRRVVASDLGDNDLCSLLSHNMNPTQTQQRSR